MNVYDRNPRKSKFKTFFIILATVAITIAISEFVRPMIIANANNNSQRLSMEEERNEEESTNKDTEYETTSSLEDTMNSVVGISVLKPDGSSILDPFVTEKWGIGTGIIISEEGYILTNQHLATKVNSKVKVTLPDGKETDGKVVWTEGYIDLAIVKINESNLTKANLGDSSDLIIGEDVFAVGNPLGTEFQRSVTRGIISGINRTLKVEDEVSSVIMENLIQTDASINTGNSGGPLINHDGEVIGVNTVKITSAEGIGFAVPINIIKPILEKLKENGEFEEGYLGIYAYDKEVAKYIDSKIDIENGIYVTEVNEKGPSQKAGIKVGDIITHIDDQEINKMIELREYIYSKNIGDTVTLKIQRGNKEEAIEVKLTKK